MTGAFHRGEPARAPFRVHRDGLGDGSGQRPASRPGCGPVSVIKVVPAVWRRALALAGGDAQRLQVLSPTTVVVHNDGRRHG